MSDQPGVTRRGFLIGAAATAAALAAGVPVLAEPPIAFSWKKLAYPVAVDSLTVSCDMIDASLATDLYRRVMPGLKTVEIEGRAWGVAVSDMCADIGRSIWWSFGLPGGTFAGRLTVEGNFYLTEFTPAGNVDLPNDELTTAFMLQSDGETKFLWEPLVSPSPVEAVERLWINGRPLAIAHRR